MRVDFNVPLNKDGSISDDTIIAFTSIELNSVINKLVLLSY